MIPAELMYKSIRQEILDQKKCQFNLFGASVTITAAILAYSAASNVSPIVFIPPVILNMLATLLILDKATSIQRMVGYLQLMEHEFKDHKWKWEYHLSKFRKTPSQYTGIEGFRRHHYVVTVATILLVLNGLCCWLFFQGPAVQALRASDRWSSVAEFYGAAEFVVIGLIIVHFITAIIRWSQLMFGKFTGGAVRARWIETIKNAESEEKMVSDNSLNPTAKATG